MKLIDILTQLQQLSIPILQTGDVSAYFNINLNHANKLLTRLAETRQIIRIKHGTWVFPYIEPLTLPALLTAPFPAYISLQTALYHHGMISQIPSIIYAVSLARTKKYKTPMANVSIHHIQPSFFFGFKQTKENPLIQLATPEKALIDVFYLSSTKTRLFHTLPELELPNDFNLSHANKIIERITSIRKRTLVRRLFYNVITNNRMI